MANDKLERTLEALGDGDLRRGIVAAAFYTDRSVPTVYGWRTAGRIFDSQDLLIIHEKAQAAGVEVTLAELAGVAIANGDADPNGTSARRLYAAPTKAGEKVPEKAPASSVASLHGSRKKKGSRHSSTPWMTGAHSPRLPEIAVSPRQTWPKTGTEG